MRVFHRYLFLLLLAALAAGCNQQPVIQPSGRTVEIGVIGPFSGPDANLGKSGLQGIKVALALHPLLDNGDKIELRVEDDMSQPEAAVEALDRLYDKEVAAVLLLSRSNSALILADKRRWKKVPIIATIASHPELTETSPHIIQLSFDDAFQGTVAALYLRDELLLERAAVISDPEDLHSCVLAETFLQQFTEANGVVLEHIAMSAGNMDLRDALVDLKRQDVEVLYVPVRAGTLLHVATSLKKINWKPEIMTGDGLLSEILLKHQDDLDKIDGMMATDMHSSLLAKTAYGEDVVAMFGEQKGDQGSTFTVLGSEGMSILLQALNRCEPSYDQRDVQRQLRETRHFEGFSGPLSIGRNGKVIRPVYVNTIRGDQLELMVKVY